MHRFRVWAGQRSRAAKKQQDEIRTRTSFPALFECMETCIFIGG